MYRLYIGLFSKKEILFWENLLTFTEFLFSGQVYQTQRRKALGIQCLGYGKAFWQVENSTNFTTARGKQLKHTLIISKL